MRVAGRYGTLVKGSVSFVSRQATLMLGPLGLVDLPGGFSGWLNASARLVRTIHAHIRDVVDPPVVQRLVEANGSSDRGLQSTFAESTRHRRAAG